MNLEIKPNRYFVYEGKTLRAAGSDINHAINYYSEGRRVFFGRPERHKTEITNGIRTLHSQICQTLQ